MTIRIPFRRLSRWLVVPAVALLLPTTRPLDSQVAGSPPASSVSEEPSGFFTEVMDVRVINVEVFVSDRKGIFVAGLGPDDFQLEVDGKPLAISNFYAEAGGQVRQTERVTVETTDTSFRPVEEVAAETRRRSHVVLLLDHSRLSANNRKRTLRSVREALGLLGKEDLVSVVGVEGSLVFYSDFLFDRQAVDRVLEEVTRVSVQSDINETERRLIFGELTRGQSGGVMARRFSGAESQPILSRIQAYAAQEYDRGVRSLQQIEHVVLTLAGVPGRKMLLYVAEGIPTRPGEGLFVEWRNRFGGGSPDAEIGLRRFDFNTDYVRSVGRFDLGANMLNLARAANRAGVTLYTIDAEGDHGGIIRSALTEQGATSETLSVINENYREPLEYAAKATGGRFLTSSGKLAEQLVEVVGDLDSFYSLGFTAPAGWEPGSDHDIRVKLKSKGFRVRHREEVRLPEPDEREAGATLAALRYQAANNPLGLRAAPASGTVRTDGTAVVPVMLEIPIARLEFLPEGEAQAGSLSIYVSTKDAKGDASKVQKIPFHLAIPNEVMDRARTDSARYELPVVLRPGDQQLAIGVRDNVGGVFSAVRVDVSRFAPTS